MKIEVFGLKRTLICVIMMSGGSRIALAPKRYHCALKLNGNLWPFWLGEEVIGKQSAPQTAHQVPFLHPAVSLERVMKNSSTIFSPRQAKQE
jgi:hypothetical protein